CRVRRLSSITSLRHHGSEIDDPPALLLEHQSYHGFCTEEDALQIYVNDAIPFFLFETQQQIVESQARIIDQNIDPAMPLDNGLYCCRHFRPINNVETAQLCLPAFGYDGGASFFRRRLLLHIVDQHQRLCVSKSLGNGAPNTARGASYER